MLAVGTIASAAGGAPSLVPPGVQALFPAPDATNAPPDAPLHMTLASAAAVGKAGKVHIVDAASGFDVATLDVSNPTARQAIGGVDGFQYYPFIVSGRQVDLYPPNHSLDYNKTYYVTVEPQTFSDADGKFTGITSPTAWRFTTQHAAPETGAARLVVAADGSGDFCTIQGAVDFLPDGNTSPVTVFIRKGTYTEIVCFTGKNAITFQGEDRKGTIIAYANNNTFNPTGSPYRRGMFEANRCTDITIANLTMHNTTPYRGSQAEAIILNGTAAGHAILADVDLDSFQDTLQINGQAYVSHCNIRGDVDFMWGTGPVYFEDCTCTALHSNAYYTQIRNTAANHGYVFDKCRFDGTAGVTGMFLSRIEPGRFPYSEVVLLDCTLGPSVGAAAWRFDAAAPARGRAAGPPPATNSAAGSNVHFWEYNSTTLDGGPAETSKRFPASRRLNENDDGETIAHYRDVSWVLGGWTPKVPAALTTQPAVAPHGEPPPAVTAAPYSQSALRGTSPYFFVKTAATSVRYSWTHDGQPIPGATAATLRIDGTKDSDAGDYVVTLTNAAGIIKCDPAHLTVVAPASTTPPALPSIPRTVTDVAQLGAVADGVTDNTSAIQKAIASASSAGGGIVEIPPANQPYLCGPISLASGVDLQIDRGATLQLLPLKAAGATPAYPLAGARYSDFIKAAGLHDVAITGGGTIDGQGADWWAAFRGNANMAHRPFMIGVSNCSRVLVSDVTLTNSPMFHLAPGSTENLTIFGITIKSAANGPNTDGIDPSGEHQLIQNCNVSVGDDNIAVKAGGAFCSDIMIADCTFGAGHGVSVGGQSNRGLDGMTVRNCTFNGTTSGLRLKADATQGGAVKNIRFEKLTMTNVQYPIVFYSYYKNVGSPGSISGSNQTTVGKVNQWNAQPPNSLASRTLPSWKDITIDGLTATGSTGHSIIWGLPTADGLIADVTLHDVRIPGAPAFEIYDATNVQVTGKSDIGKPSTCNSLVIASQPSDTTAIPGQTVEFNVQAAGGSGAAPAELKYRWNFNGRPLTDGKRIGSYEISGATTAGLRVINCQAVNAGSYSVMVSTALDSYNTTSGALESGKIPSSATSVPALLTVMNQPP
jgi:pectin methylesterase-like acyl-CoA thioesterase